MPQIQGETIGQQTEKTYKQAVTGNAVTALQLGSGKENSQYPSWRRAQ